MIQAFSLIFNFFNIASPCGDMGLKEQFLAPKKITDIIRVIILLIIPCLYRIKNV
jgi:hypothetical protein